MSVRLSVPTAPWTTCRAARARKSRDRFVCGGGGSGSALAVVEVQRARAVYIYDDCDGSGGGERKYFGPTPGAATTMALFRRVARDRLLA